MKIETLCVMFLVVFNCCNIEHCWKWCRPSLCH